MGDVGNRDFNKKIKALERQIDRMKQGLIFKYGPHIAKRWEVKRERQMY